MRAAGYVATGLPRSSRVFTTYVTVALALVPLCRTVREVPA